MKKDPKHLMVPVNLIEVAIKSRQQKAFALLCFLKYQYDGPINKVDFFITNLPRQLCIKDYRTLDVQMKVLLKSKWLGYCIKTDKYFLRSWDFLCNHEGVNSEMKVMMAPEHLEDYRVYMFSAIVGYKMIVLKHYLLRIAKIYKKRGGMLMKRYGPKKESGPLQYLELKTSSFYFGMSNQRLGKYTNLSRSRVSELKSMAHKKGFLYVKKHWEIYKFMSPKADVRLELLHTVRPEHRKRMKIIKDKRSRLLKVVFQLHDEIRPLLLYRSERDYAKESISRSNSSSH